MVINYLLLTGPFILGITAGALAASKLMDMNAAQGVSTALHLAIPVALGVGIFGKVIETVQAGYKMVTQDLSVKA
jgi:hypothetical protein